MIEFSHWRAFIDRRDYDRQWALFFAELFEDGSTAVIEPVTVRKFAPGEIAQGDPTLIMPAEKARAMLQALVDAAWKEGVRPSALDDFRKMSDGAAAHLADMRKLVAKLTETPLD